MAKASALDRFEQGGNVRQRRDNRCAIGRSPHRGDYEEAFSVRGWSYSTIMAFAKNVHGEQIGQKTIYLHCKQKSCSCHG